MEQKSQALEHDGRVVADLIKGIFDELPRTGRQEATTVKADTELILLLCRIVVRLKVKRLLHSIPKHHGLQLRVLIEVGSIYIEPDEEVPVARYGTLRLPLIADRLQCIPAHEAGLRHGCIRRRVHDVKTVIATEADQHEGEDGREDEVVQHTGDADEEALRRRLLVEAVLRDLITPETDTVVVDPVQF